MAEDLEKSVWTALKTIKFPGMSRDIVSFGFVHQVKAAAGSVAVELQMATHNPAAGEKVREEVRHKDLALFRRDDEFQFKSVESAAHGWVGRIC